MNNPDSYFDELDEINYMIGLDWYGPKRNGNENMEKKFIVMRPNQMTHKTYEEAEKQAKQFVARNHDDYVIVQAVALANTPTPDVSVTKL